MAVAGVCVAASCTTQHLLYCSTFVCSDCSTAVQVLANSPWHAAHAHACSACSGRVSEDPAQRRYVPVS